MNYAQFAQKIKAQALNLGFSNIRITSASLPQTQSQRLHRWLEQGYHGSMSFFEKHGTNRTDGRYILPETQSIIICSMPYGTDTLADLKNQLNNHSQAYISSYARGRDYHKVLRQRLKKLSGYIQEIQPKAICRPVVDSAPISEVSFSVQSGLGWQGKNTLLIQKNYGSLFFIGAVLTNLPLPPDSQEQPHCGNCCRCLNNCPTKAIISPYQIDANRCLSYLTIEYKKIIPVEFRKLLGNRIYGCDDCQLVCPFNRFHNQSTETDFAIRNHLDQISLLELLGWSENTFRQNMAGSPILRIGYEKWLSNIIIASGNAPKNLCIQNQLSPLLNHPSPLIHESAQWSIKQQQG